ncbi:MAG: FAD-dependent thymidylate synthase [Clostridia bacterium]|nr:FAD-dependent thymidylate synthase [Clostridia bacterium]
MLKVQLLQYTPNAEQLVAAAAKLCYSSAGITEVMDKLDAEKTEKFLQMLSSIGHESPIEHVSFTFGIEGVSRSLLAQLTRHRIASYSVKSQRYVTEGAFTFVIPPEIEKNEQAKEIYLAAMQRDQEDYDALTEILFNKHFADMLKNGDDEKSAKTKAQKKAIEDARYVLPNACETKLMATFNARSLHNFFAHRLCERAQWEIRAMAEEMLRLVKEVAPTLFGRCAPPCVYGSCPEGKMSCGKVKEKRAAYKGAETC